MIKGQPDKVSLSVPENKYTATNVQLSWAGLATPLAPASSTVSSGKRVFVFDLPAFNNDDEFAIYAVSDNLKIGKLNVVVYEPIAKNVVIVPLAGTIDAAQLTTQLKETLGEAGLNFTVEISDTLGVGKYAANSSLNIPDATLMSKYSGKMRQIRNSYFDKHDSENDTYYLFVVSSLMDTVNNQSVDGYMVRGKSVGFVQTGTSLHTLAHELGHGIGALEHSWKNNGPEQGGTNNLMDYSNGENLILAQWTELRNPKGQGFWDEEDSFEAVSNSLKGKNVFYFWEYEADNSIKDNLMGYYYLSDPNNYNSRKIIYATQWLKIKDITGYDYPQSCNTLFGAKEAFKIATKNSGNCVGCSCYSNEVIFETRSPQSQTSIIVKNNGSLSYLEGETHSGAIVYINVYGENILTGKRKYSHTSNQIYLEKYKYKTDMTEHHYVLSLRDENDKIIEQKVFRLVDSKDVTQELVSGDSYVSTVNKNVFYFWKEDSDGFIVDNVIMKPLSTQKRLAYMDQELSEHYTSIQKIKDDIVYNASLESSYMMVNLPYPQSHEEMSTVVFEKGGKVHRIPAAESHNKVLYFNVINNKYKYEYASNKLDLKYWNYNGDVFTHFYVLTYWGLDQSGNSVITNQKVFSYANGDVTEQYKKYKSLSGPLIHTVFVNGYRPNQGWDPIWNAGGLEKAESNNKITTQDFTSYWNENEIGSKLIERLKPIHVYYADGHFSAETSNHYGPLNAYGNMQVFENHIGTICDKSVDASKHHCSTHTESASGPGGGAAITIVFKDELATQSNVAGFQQRYNAGKIAGQNLIKELKKKTTQAEKNQGKTEHNFSQDTIDFVAHSMGFAYSLGMIDELKGKINFGNYLILAPENAGAAQGSAALTNYFQTIWHYGSNLGMVGEDPVCMQDGVAPQTNIPGLSNNRIAIPNTEEHNKKKGYGESHYHGFFGWIFTEITIGTKGYIKQRK